SKRRSAEGMPSTVAQGVASSLPAAAPAALAAPMSTATSARPKSAVAGTSRRPASAPKGTARLQPSSTNASPEAASRTVGAVPSGSPSASCQATVATSSPAASRAPIVDAPAHPARSSARAATAAEIPKGDTMPRPPISCATMEATRASSMPPSASRVGAASRPASASAACTCAQVLSTWSSSRRAAASRIMEYSSGATKARTVASWSAGVFIVLTEEAPGGDVALDLARAGVDRRLAQAAVRGGHAGRREGVHAEDAGLQLGDVLLQVRAEDLEQRGIEFVAQALLEAPEHLQVHELDASEPRLDRAKAARDGRV